MATKSHKDQHFVPACYLKAWCDPDSPVNHEPYLWLFDRNSREGRPKAPRNIFSEKDFYTEIDQAGQRDLSLEHFLNRLETRFSDIRRNFVDKRAPLTPTAHILLCFFCAAMHSRTRAMRDHVRSQWLGLLEHGEKLEAWARTASPEQLRSMQSPFPRSEGSKSMDLDDVRHIVNNPAQTAIRNSVRIESRLYAVMDLAILCTDDSIGFITSDHPCIWFDPELQGAPAWRAPGLGSRTIEVLLPLSPASLLVFSRQGLRGYIRANKAMIQETNRMVRFGADRAYVVRHNYTHDYWFDPNPQAPPG